MNLLRSTASDTRTFLRRLYSYFYWNARGVRVTPECYIDVEANVAPTCSFFGFTRIYWRARVGHFTYGANAIIDNGHIGKFCSLAPGCIIGPDRHPVDFISTHPKTYDAHAYQQMIPPAKIGHDVWIGANALIMAGITIGDGSVIGGGAVVTKDVEPFTIVGGVPARVIKQRHGDRSFVDAIAQTDDVSELKELAARMRAKSPGKSSE